jgi:hypothetical protein
VKADAHIATDIHLVSQQGLQVSIRNATVKTPETSKRIHSKCGPFSKKQKSVKHLLLDKQVSAFAAQFK